jgi:light-regulated signal transduction histidine kinase (bacteriophytochrome)
LARSNEELEQFAYVASHDLSEPLRTVAGFVQLLSQRYKGRLDADADEFIGFALDGVTRMQALIQDLLTYSRVSRLEYKLDTVDAGAMVADLAQANTGPGAVTWSALPIVQADPGQLRRVFQNLIGNGLKFVGPGREPHVHVSAAREGAKWCFAVKDNGIGVPARHHERIFKMFQRLHSQDDFPGTGIGLAVCQRIIERHGGEMWVESTEGVGSTFFFTLAVPKRSEPSQPPAAQKM